MAGLVYFHGGGAISLRPEHLNGKLARFCLGLDLVVFNVDYRLCPEIRSPEGFKDGVAAVKYFKENAA